MSSSGDSFDSWSEQVDSTQGTSSASNLSSSSRSQSAGSVLGITPGFSTPHESEGFASSTSSSYDPILGHFALHTPLASSAAPLSQPLSKPNTLSSDETTESGETGFHSAESNPKRAVWALGTPATSEASQEAENPPTVYQDNAALATPIDLALVGLELRDEYQAEPLFCDANNVNHADIVNEILEILENEHTSHQAKTNAIPWIPGTQDVQWPAFDDSILAPAPGLTYLKYYSPTRTHTQKHRRHEKKTQRKRKATVTCPNTQSTPLGFPSNITVTGTPEYDPEITPHIPSQRSMVWTESQSRRQQDLFNGSAEWLQGTSKQSQICRAVDCVNFSPEILGSIFLPSFALAHLSPSSLSNFTSKLIAPNGLAYNFEYTIDLTLGFGPTMTHNVCAFAPRNGEELQSYQKHQGEDELYVQGSLPIVLNLFSLDSHAEELDAWLDGIIDSELGLQEYIELMQRRQNEHLFIEVLRCLAAWYSTSKNKISRPAHHTFRTALKLLMTTTLLSLVPKLENIPESLFQCLSPQCSAPRSTCLSPIAPKLLTRQIKASIHHLQHHLLHALFCYFACGPNLAAEVKVATALLLACVLELAQSAGRQFARFASKIDPTVVVKPQDVEQYEMNMQKQIFGRVRASVSDTTGKMGALGERLRNIGSIVKGKGKDSQKCEFVSVILHTVL